MGSVTVERRAGAWRDLARSYTVEIDGEAVGKIGRNEALSFDLAPGSHSVRMKIDWCSSPTVNVSGDADTKLICKPGGSALLAFIDILFRPGEYISLERA